jgi:uncharacterized protein YkwD
MNNVALALTFKDVKQTHPYGSAIEELKKTNVIQGYPDGSFRPDNLINRVEYLKIILDGTGVPLNVDNKTGFSDVSEKEWYSPYLQKAACEGWIEGYPDNTFRPDQPINKAEAYKILGEVQNWDRPAREEVPKPPFDDTFRFGWYSPYVYFAKENNLIFEEDKYFYPETNITRGYMAELIYQTQLNGVNRFVPDKSIEEHLNDYNEVKPPDISPEISTDFFDHIRLSESLPTVFYENEIYMIEGEITDINNPGTIFAFVSEKVDENEYYEHYTGKISGNNFEIPVTFNRPGEYKIGIVPDESEDSKVVSITVLDGIPKRGALKNSDAPYNLNVYFKNRATHVTWQSDSADVFRVYFIQDDAVHSYFARNKKHIKIIYEDFWKFDECETTLVVLSAKAESFAPVNLQTGWAASKHYRFESIKHQFNLIDETALSFIDFPEFLSYVTDVKFSGKTKSPVLDKGAVITPDGDIEYINIDCTEAKEDYYGNKLIPALADISFNYRPKSEGTYILEINSESGSAVFNAPVYIGEGVPLVPDFFDMQDPYEVTKELDLETARKELQNYINVERNLHGLNSLALNDNLNTLAQNHADDMKNRDFFSHINPDGETPDDRRIKMGITTTVGENLAHAPTLYFAHEALMRSALHRNNVLNENWDKIGIGLALDGEGYLLIVEEFSYKHRDENDTGSFKHDLIINN